MKKLKHAKRLLSLMLAITMVVTALPSTSITSLASPVSETLEAQPEPTTSGNGEDQTQDNDKKSDTTVSDESIPTAPEGETKTPTGDESNKDESNTVDDQGQGSNDIAASKLQRSQADPDKKDKCDQREQSGRSGIPADSKHKTKCGQYQCKFRADPVCQDADQQGCGEISGILSHNDGPAGGIIELKVTKERGKCGSAHTVIDAEKQIA